MSSTAKSATSIKEARELYELKERAAKYYAENGVPQKMEEILNSMFYDNPPDVFGHLVNYFQSFANAPVISKIKSRKAVDGKGQNTIQTDVFCTVNNKEKMLSSVVNSSVTPAVPDTGKAEDMEEEIKERDTNVDAAIQIINTEICTKLQGLQPTQQNEIDVAVWTIYGSQKERAQVSIMLPELSEDQQSDELVAGLKAVEDERLAKEAEQQGETEGQDADKMPPGSSISKGEKPKSGKSKGGKGGPAVVVVPDEPREKMLSGSTCVSATSQAICVAGANASGLELYDYIAQLRFGQSPKQLRLPLPMVTILQGGRVAPGKSNCVKEYMLVPKPGTPLSEAVPQIVAIYNDVIKSALGKNGIVVKNVTDLGALMLPFDKPEQGLDLLQESMTRLGLTPGEDMFIALNLAGQEIFDYEKGKYEVVTGQQKLAEDMGDFWADIVTRYPAIIALIDPLRKQEDKAWMMLCEKLSEKCYILGDNVWHRPGLLKSEELTEEFKSSGNIYRLEQLNTITDIIECAKKMEDVGNETVLATNLGETTDSFIADMAVGINARFLKVGAPCRGERVSKLNRLVSIEVALQEMDRLVPHGDFQFPVITIPPPPEPEEEPEEPEVKESPKKK